MGSSFVFMTRDEVLSHSKKYSRSLGIDLWESEFDAMAKKTVIKKLLKYAPFSDWVEAFGGSGLYSSLPHCKA